MATILQLFIWIPIAGFFISLLIPRKKEKIISGISIGTTGIHLVSILTFIIFWLSNKHPLLDIKHITLFKSENIEIFIDFYFDKTSAVFALTGSFIAFLVSIFSKYYLHRDEGFKRFFNVILLFFLSYNLIIFSGNFETLFIGWEILGICSFLLIAFYRDRYLPVKNSMKVISVYRFGDICLMLAMWMSHHLWHENITFVKLNDIALVKAHLLEHNWFALFIALMIVIAATVKSAQIPFSSWLPRAMEGPTTSSAVFYGSLSVHIGVFLLIRTFPYWESIAVIKILILLIGIFTAVIATSIAKVQSSVKVQIAYSSIAQIGLMFIEVALGFHVLALIHFVGNALLRTYQLLVSPSVLSYLTHNMFFNFTPSTQPQSNHLISKIKNTIYILSIKEYHLDTFQNRILWKPFKWIGKYADFITKKNSIIVLIVFYLFGCYAYFVHHALPVEASHFLPYLFSFIAILLVLKAFSERGNAIRAWLFVVSGQLFITLSIALYNEKFDWKQILIYLSGISIAAIIGYICLRKTKEVDKDILLNKFHGYVYEQPKIAFVFLLCCLALVGLPFTPTFIGIDLLFSHIHKHELVLIILTSIIFVFIELSILRIYARIFLGQYKKNKHAMAYKSS